MHTREHFPGDRYSGRRWPETPRVGRLRPKAQFGLHGNAELEAGQLQLILSEYSSP